MKLFVPVMNGGDPVSRNCRRRLRSEARRRLSDLLGHVPLPRLARLPCYESTKDGEVRFWKGDRPAPPILNGYTIEIDMEQRQTLDDSYDGKKLITEPRQELLLYTGLRMRVHGSEIEIIPQYFQK